MHFMTSEALAAAAAHAKSNSPSSSILFGALFAVVGTLLALNFKGVSSHQKSMHDKASSWQLYLAEKGSPNVFRIIGVVFAIFGVLTVVTGLVDLVKKG